MKQSSKGRDKLSNLSLILVAAFYESCSWFKSHYLAAFTRSHLSKPCGCLRCYHLSSSFHLPHFPLPSHCCCPSWCWCCVWVWPESLLFALCQERMGTPGRVQGEPGRAHVKLQAAKDFIHLWCIYLWDFGGSRIWKGLTHLRFW